MSSASITQWPRLALWYARLRKPEDTGLGDTLARQFGAVGGKVLIGYYEKLTGHGCGCLDRQAALNERFPYPPPQE